MKSTDKDTLAASWPALIAQHQKFANSGSPTPTAPKRMRPSSIQRWPGVFQHRQQVGGTQSRAHVDGLMRGAHDGDLAPLVVWWDGRAWACIDGHHRLEAYHWAEKDDHEVPVVAFTGTPAEAMAEAARLNTPNKLPMSKSEKSNAAWRLVVVAEELSREATARAASVSPSSVANMRKVKRKLLDELALWDQADPLEHAAPRLPDLMAMSWPEAKDRAAGVHRDGLADPDEREARAQAIANILTTEVGPFMLRQPDIIARALELVHAQLPDWLMEVWKDGDDGDSGDEKDW